jgi:hypothetical protein
VRALPTDRQGLCCADPANVLSEAEARPQLAGDPRASRHPNLMSKLSYTVKWEASHDGAEQFSLIAKVEGKR